MNPHNFFAELKRRNVYKVGIAYLVVGWLLVQVATQVFPFLEIPNWAIRLVIMLVAIGFPIALVIAWAFESTPEGIKRTETADAAPKKSSSGAWMYVVAIGVVASVALFSLGRYTAKPRAAAPAELPSKSIAVLPFENLSANQENAFFTDGVQDEILTDLAKVADLKVISRTSVMQYKSGARNLQEIARALKVSHVVEGSVQRSVNRVRVTAQLIDARTDTHLWAEKYDRDLSDVFAIQSEIAKTIADELRAKLSPREEAAMQEKPTKDLAVYDLYLRAKELNRTLSYDNAPIIREVALLEEAVARDPAFVSAYCLLAEAHLDLYWFNEDHTGARLELAKKAIDAAARLKPDAGEVHVARALYYYHGQRDYAPALAELAIARRTLPNDSTIVRYLAAMERRQGHMAESTAHWEEAVAMDPRNTVIIQELSANYGGSRRYADRVRLLEGVLSWKPNDFGLATELAFADFDQSGDLHRFQALLNGEAVKSADPNELADARLTLAFLRRDYPAAQLALAEYRLPDFRRSGFIEPREGAEGAIWKGLGDAAKARVAFEVAREKAATTVNERPEDPNPLIVLAGSDADLDRKEDAIREGERAVALLPVEKDALDGAMLLNRTARIYAKVGEKNRAMDLLERLATIPFGVQYGWLKLDSDWDPLRGDPRFAKILASLSPKDTDR